mmetsp:Transcript_3416/g.6544  ORF Transcript_3416/g.6544 Transcript_3416/m.6544 type:complete len:153 (-) Transcript_3416:140-598(-)
MSSSVEQVTTTCQTVYHDSVRLYHCTLAASIALALFCLSIRHLCLRDLIGVPALASQFYFVIGTLQLMVSALDMSVFLPHCPDECLEYSCSNKYKPVYFVYPLLATSLGVLLYREAMYQRDKARAISSSSDENGNPIVVFQRIPEMEMQDGV